MFPKLRLILAFFCLCLAWSLALPALSPAAGGTGAYMGALILPRPAQPAAPSAKRPPWRVEANTGWAAEAGFDGHGGKSSAWGASAKLTWVDFSIAYEQFRYSWDDIPALPFGNGRDDPWRDLHILSLGYNRFRPIDAKWNYFLGGVLSSAFEKEVESDSLTGTVFGGTVYILSPDVVLTFGAGAAFHRVRTLVLPVLGFSWRKPQQNGLSLALGYPQTFLAYRFNQSWALRSRIVEFDQDIFSLASDSSVAPRGFLERRDLKAGLGLEYNPLPGMSLVAGVQYYFFREMNIYTKDADREEDYDPDGAWGGVLRLDWRF